MASIITNKLQQPQIKVSKHLKYKLWKPNPISKIVKYKSVVRGMPVLKLFDLLILIIGWSKDPPIL